MEYVFILPPLLLSLFLVGLLFVGAIVGLLQLWH